MVLSFRKHLDPFAIKPNVVWCFLMIPCSVLLLNYRYAQAQRMDSLYRIVDRSDEDSISWKKTMTLLNYWNSSDGRVGLVLVKRLLEVSGRTNDNRKIGAAYQMLGVSYGMVGEYDSSLMAFGKAITYAERSGSYVDEMENYQNKGVTEDLLSRYRAAFKSYLKALDIANAHGLEKARIYGCIAQTYMNTGDYTSALHYHSMATEAAETENPDDNLKDLLRGNLAANLLALRRYDEARQILLNLIAKLKKTEHRYFLGNHYEELARVELATGHYQAARSYALDAKRNLQKVGAKGEMPELFALLAKIEFMDEDFAAARAYAEEAKRLTDSVNALDILPEICGILAHVHLIEKRYGPFLHYDSLYRMYTDSLNLTEQNKAVAELNVQYESERKEKENLMLKANQLALDAHIIRQRYVIIIAALLLTATIVLLLIIRQRSAISKRNNLLLSDKNAAIEIQAKEIFLQKREIEMKNDELTRTVEEVRMVQEQLVHAEKMSSLGQMTAGIAHEINNPLNFIAGSAQTLKFSHEEFIKEARQAKVLDRQWIDEVEAESLNLFNALDDGVYRISKIISSLKAFSSPHQAKMVEASVIDLVEMSLTLVNAQLVENHIEVVRNYQSPISPVMLNPTQMTQVFTNIISNAIDAMATAEDPQLIVHVTNSAEMVQIAFSDNGCGIPFDIQSRIFDRFFTTKPPGRGTGLGLSISSEFLEKHRGNLKFVSEPRKGTIFIIELPTPTPKNKFDGLR